MCSVSRDPIVFILIDDDDMREHLVTLVGTVGLEARGVARPSQFLAVFDPERPGCLLSDLRLPEMSGIELLEHLRGRRLRIPVIVVSGHGDVTAAVRAMKAGAADFLETPLNDQALIERVQRCVEADAARLVEDRRRADAHARYATLTPREREVFRLLVDGAANKEIALRLGLSPRTVENHRTRIAEKLGTRSVALLARMAGSLESEDG